MIPKPCTVKIATIMIAAIIHGDWRFSKPPTEQDICPQLSQPMLMLALETA
jgi:hypothetical protein